LAMAAREGEGEMKWPEENTPPPERGSRHDTDEWLRTTPNGSDESRTSIEKGEGFGRRPLDAAPKAAISEIPRHEPNRRRDGANPTGSGCDRNDDFMGNEAKLSTDADYFPRSDGCGGKIWGEDR